MLSSQPFDLKERCDSHVNDAKYWFNEYRQPGGSLSELVVAVFKLGRASEVLRELKAMDEAAHGEDGTLLGERLYSFRSQDRWLDMRQRLVESVPPADVAQIRDLYYASADFYNKACYEIQSALVESGAGGYSFNQS